MEPNKYLHLSIIIIFKFLSYFLSKLPLVQQITYYRYELNLIYRQHSRANRVINNIDDVVMECLHVTSRLSCVNCYEIAHAIQSTKKDILDGSPSGFGRRWRWFGAGVRACAKISQRGSDIDRSGDRVFGKRSKRERLIEECGYYRFFFLIFVIFLNC